jgi:phage tail sheath protein FI
VVTDAIHDQLHLMGINVYRAERDGFRLSAARTLSSDPDYRQLSVRRLITSLEETLTQQCQWLVFEPNTAELRTRLTHAISLLLRDLHRRGYLAGASEEESYFVRCDDSNNPVQSQALGRLVAEVGVAPASPLEYIVLQISADVDGNVTVEASRG